jgi:hypothetical protein
MDDPFEVLGLRPGATAKEITSAYRRLVKLYHPDIQGQGDDQALAEAERRMLEINHARHVLRSRTRSTSNPKAHPSLLTSHYLIFTPLGYRSPVLFVVRDETGFGLGDVTSGRSRSRESYAREVGASYSIGSSQDPLLEVSRLQGRITPMVKIENLQSGAVIGHIASRNGVLSMESLDVNLPSATMAKRGDYYIVVGADEEEIARVEELPLGTGRGFAVTVSPEADERLRMFLLAAPLAVQELT